MDKEMLKYFEKSFKFLTVDKIRKHNKRLYGVNYCVLGFPEGNVLIEDGRLDTGASFYLTSATNENPYQYYNFGPQDHFIVEMKGKGIDVKTGNKVKVDSHFNGISGCGLWYLMYDMNPSTGEYSIDYRLIGIMTEYKKTKYFCLISNKIHLIIDAFRIIEGYKYNEIHIS